MFLELWIVEDLANSMALIPGMAFSGRVGVLGKRHQIRWRSLLRGLCFFTILVCEMERERGGSK